jgi:glucose-6-phosphate isomerase
MLHETESFAELERHLSTWQGVHMRDLFVRDQQRFEKFHRKFQGIIFDYSKHRVNDETMRLLTNLARARGVEQQRARMFAGEPVNATENRPVLHVALRHRGSRTYLVNGVDVMPEVRRVLAQMRVFSDAVRSGQHTGYTGKPITDVVNIGIGGSDLGPLMVVGALRPYAHPRIKSHFVSNVDSTHIQETLRQLDPETTLFLIASKTFTTQETMTNAATARRWFLDQAKDSAHVAAHFVALSTNLAEVQQFGIHPDNMFVFWDWVGGRYSLWSAVGLSIAIAVGMDNFEALLKGAAEADDHFEQAPLEHNIPVTMALLGVWCCNFLNASSHAVLPYDQSLSRFPAYLQQADMESNGKSCSRAGRQIVGYDTGPVIWGEPGTNGQHAFYQLIHQGTRLIPVDFIVAMESHNSVGDHHAKLVANVIAQGEALMRGQTQCEAVRDLIAKGMSPDAAAELAPHKVFPGSRPSTTFLTPKLSPRVLGQLIAFYEHKIFVQGVIWNVYSFDQWGVELGKELAQRVLAEFTGPRNDHDVSTTAMITHYRATRTVS